MTKEDLPSSEEKSNLSEILRDYFDQRKKEEETCLMELEEVKEEMQKATDSFQNCMQTQKMLTDAFEYLNQKK